MTTGAENANSYNSLVQFKAFIIKKKGIYLIQHNKNVMAFSRVATIVKNYNKQFLIKKGGLLKSYIYIIIIYLYRLCRQKAKKKASSHVVSNKKHNGVEDCFLDIFLILLLFFLIA